MNSDEAKNRGSPVLRHAKWAHPKARRAGFQKKSGECGECGERHSRIAPGERVQAMEGISQGALKVRVAGLLRGIGATTVQAFAGRLHD